MLSCVLGIRDIAISKVLADNIVNICNNMSDMRNAMRKNISGKGINSNGVLGYYFK